MLGETEGDDPGAGGEPLLGQPDAPGRVLEWHAQRQPRQVGIGVVLAVTEVLGHQDGPFDLADSSFPDRGDRPVGMEKHMGARENGVGCGEESATDERATAVDRDSVQSDQVF